jgi:endogenous inhibitor of DNA gyrase (YacG/DUF329 family)
MCFRPAQTSKPEPCPHCGRDVKSINGIRPKRCPYCKEIMEEENKKNQ